MVSAAVWAAIALVGLIGQETDEASDPSAEPAQPVRSALAKGQYPWYNARKDAVQPVWPTETDWDSGSSSKSPGWSFAPVGELVGYGLAMLALAVLIVVLVELWRRYRPEAGEVGGQVKGHGTARRIEGLLAGVRPETADLWNEARQRRARGDYAGAIICLFTHQLLTLERLRQIRLIPGRTGRQLVRAVDDPRYRGWVDPTLRLFEAVYYGHRAPSAEAFERVWSLAEEFERHLAAGPVS